jgi:hypothetical protein
MASKIKILIAQISSVEILEKMSILQKVTSIVNLMMA